MTLLICLPSGCAHKELLNIHHAFRLNRQVYTGDDITFATPGTVQATLPAGICTTGFRRN